MNAISAERLLDLLKQEGKPLPPPERYDWLARNPEDGQTFAEVNYGINAGRDARRSLTLFVTPEVPVSYPRIVECLADFLAAYFQIPFNGWHELSPDKLGANDRRAQQLRTTGLRRLLPNPKPGEKRVLITAFDLYPEENAYNYVFGEADHAEGQASAVLSLFQYEIPTNTTLQGLPLTRLLKVTSHELGHLFCFQHCTAHLCNMNGKNNVPELDRHPLELCPECLAKWTFFTGADARKRLAELHLFYGGYNLPEEQAVVGWRLAVLNNAVIE